MTKLALWLLRWRGWVQGVSAVAMNSWLTQRLTKGLPCPGFNCYACPTAVFACPIGSLQHFAVRKKLPLYLLGSPALMGLLGGRFPCGWLCPFGWLQDLLHKLPLPKLRLPNRLTWTRYVLLVVLVGLIPLLTREPWFCKLCPQGMLQGGIPQVLLDAEIAGLIGTLFWVKLAILLAFLAWMAVTVRPFCRWFCPLGAIWGLFNPVSTLQLRVDRHSCVECGRCQAVCPMDIRVYERPNSPECIRCLACVKACPKSSVQLAYLGQVAAAPEEVLQPQR